MAAGTKFWAGQKPFRSSLGLPGKEVGKHPQLFTLHLIGAELEEGPPVSVASDLPGAERERAVTGFVWG